MLVAMVSVLKLFTPLRLITQTLSPNTVLDMLVMAPQAAIFCCLWCSS